MIDEILKLASAGSRATDLDTARTALEKILKICDSPYAVVQGASAFAPDLFHVVEYTVQQKPVEGPMVKTSAEALAQALNVGRLASVHAIRQAQDSAFERVQRALGAVKLQEPPKKLN
jgi:hypothetical protein